MCEVWSGVWSAEKNIYFALPVSWPNGTGTGTERLWNGRGDRL